MQAAGFIDSDLDSEINPSGVSLTFEVQLRALQGIAERMTASCHDAAHIDIRAVLVDARTALGELIADPDSWGYLDADLADPAVAVSDRASRETASENLDLLEGFRNDLMEIRDILRVAVISDLADYLTSREAHESLNSLAAALDAYLSDVHLWSVIAILRDALDLPAAAL